MTSQNHNIRQYTFTDEPLYHGSDETMGGPSKERPVKRLDGFGIDNIHTKEQELNMHPTQHKEEPLTYNTDLSESRLTELYGHIIHDL